MGMMVMDENRMKPKRKRKPLNQCDGCQRGLPKDTRGHHIEGSTFGLGCSANRYRVRQDDDAK